MIPSGTVRLVGLAVGVVVLAVGPTAARSPGGQAAGASDEEAVINLKVGESTVVRAPWPAKVVSVTDPTVADVKVLTPDRVLLMGKSLGSTDLLIWSEGEEVWRSRVDVGIHLGRFGAELARLFPGSALQASRSKDMVVLTGFLGRAEQVGQLHRYLEATGLKHVNMTSVAGVQQVEISVRVAEANRAAIRTLGFNAIHTGSDDNTFFGGLTIGSSGGGPLVPMSIGPVGQVGMSKSELGVSVPFEFTSDVAVSPLVTLFAGFPRADLEVFIQALAENQYLRILAEPNLAALSGEEASFLAGGEFPIPVVQGSGGGGSTAVTIEYKEFGVRLKFRPTVLGDGAIRLWVETEVSDLSDIGAVTIQGFRVPALISRRASTTLELKSGQTFGMAGLIQRNTKARNSRLPWLGDIPILGSLFRSVRYERGESELVVLVSASLVEPMSVTASGVPLPGAMHVPPNDWELFAEGRLEGSSSNEPQASIFEAMWRKELGLDRLQGPGAWASYGSPAVPSRPTSAAPQSERETTEAEASQSAVGG